MQNDVILKKMTSLTRCLDRLDHKRPEKWELLIEDYDLQDVISVNLERAVQLAVDIGLQTLLERNIQPPESMGEVFSLLNREGIVTEQLAEHLNSAVGFRNIAVHEYEDIDWKIVHAILVHYLDDFRSFMKGVLEYEG